MDKNVVEILERAANKYADEVVKRTVGENLSPRKEGCRDDSKKGARRCLLQWSSRALGSVE